MLFKCEPASVRGNYTKQAQVVQSNELATSCERVVVRAVKAAKRLQKL
jgi:hypothetical protein